MSFDIFYHYKIYCFMCVYFIYTNGYNAIAMLFLFVCFSCIILFKAYPCCMSEKAMAPHSSTLAWKIPWTEEPGKLQSMGSQSWTWLSNFTFIFHFHALEKEMATHSSVLAWRIPGTGEPGGLPSMGLHRVGHDWIDLAAATALIYCIGVFLSVLLHSV